MDEKAKIALLIVDDDPAIRKLLARIAIRAGFDVETARDGIDALDKLAERPFAIAIIDLMMPRLSGYELVQKISALEPRPIVIVATAMTNGDVASLDDSMVRRVIRKPFDVQAVAQALIETAQQALEQCPPQPVIKVDPAAAPPPQPEQKIDDAKS